MVAIHLCFAARINNIIHKRQGLNVTMPIISFVRLWFDELMQLWLSMRYPSPAEEVCKYTCDLYYSAWHL